MIGVFIGVGLVPHSRVCTLECRDVIGCAISECHVLLWGRRFAAFNDISRDLGPDVVRPLLRADLRGTHALNTWHLLVTTRVTL